MVWYFTGVYIINRTLHARLWIWILSSRGQLDISLVRYRVDHSKIKFISTRGHVISKIPNLVKWDKSQSGNSQPSSQIGICLTLPNLGFLWVFFKYPKKSKIGNPLFFPMQNTEILWILIHIYRAKHKCKWYTLYLTDCGNQMVESVIQRTCISTSSLWRHYWSNSTQTFAFTQMLKRVLCLNNENRKLQLD